MLLTAPTSVHATTFTAVASWYGGEAFNGNTMAGGDIFDEDDPTIVAHKTLPFGTTLKLQNPETGAKLYAVVQDRGPYTEGRTLDISRAGAEQLGFLKDGVAILLVTVLHRPN